jgi:hypothetical protein
MQFGYDKHQGPEYFLATNYIEVILALIFRVMISGWEGKGKAQCVTVNTQMMPIPK